MKYFLLIIYDDMMKMLKVAFIMIMWFNWGLSTPIRGSKMPILAINNANISKENQHRR